MEQTAQLRLNRDIFIAGHSNCDLFRHLDSSPPETPIRDVVDCCHVWESHADPAVRRMSKPALDPTYPTYTVGETDSDNEITRVAVVTGLKSDQNQLIDGIYIVSPRDSFIVGVSMHLWATLCMTQLWRCLVPWYSIWKGTVQDCYAQDIMLFSQHGARLVHRYRVYGGYVLNHSL